MKKIKLFLFTLFIAGSGLANALSIEVVPYNLEAGVEVMGVHVAASGKRAAQNAVILSGDIAERVADGSGIAFNSARHALLLTGNEVTSLVTSSLTGVRVAGRTVFITSYSFARQATNLALNAIDMGTYTVVSLASGMTNTAMNLTRAVADTAGQSVLLVGRTGAVVVSTGARVLGGTINVVTGVVRGILGGIFGF
ncbi:MAG: hypothetical protein R3A80_06880 [Bdellovibrionota bacterium]